MTLTIDHSSPLPRHIQVEQLLRQLIELPQYAEGEYLPGELDLAAKLGISRNTIRQATNKLELEGLIIRKKEREHVSPTKWYRQNLTTGILSLRK